MVKVSLFEIFHALKLFVMRCFNPVLIPRHSSPIVYVTGMIFDPLNKLKASCRRMASQIFFVIVVNRALNAPFFVSLFLIGRQFCCGCILSHDTVFDVVDRCNVYGRFLYLSSPHFRLKIILSPSNNNQGKRLSGILGFST